VAVSSFRRLVIVILLLAGAAAAVLTMPPAADSRGSSRLERLLEESGYSQPEKDAIERAYKGCLKAGIREREVLKLVGFSLDGDFRGEHVSRLLAVFARLELASLPLEPARLKVREGVAKGVEPADIVSAAEQSALMLNRAARIFNQLVIDGFDVGDRDDLLGAMAEALTHGKDEGEIRNIIAGVLEDGGSPRKIRRALLR
jgi:hypothetical protein